MAELMSIEVHVPLMRIGGAMTDGGGVPMEKLRKVDNDGRSLYQSAKQAVDIEFRDLTYSVSEGRQRGACVHIIIMLVTLATKLQFLVPRPSLSYRMQSQMQLNTSVSPLPPKAVATGSDVHEVLQAETEVLTHETEASGPVDPRRDQD